MYWQSELTVRSIALRFGISRTAVYDMVRRNPDAKPADEGGL
jgi:predicted DNA-binding protein YlxM (UPF0122 family)